MTSAIRTNIDAFIFGGTTIPIYSVEVARNKKNEMMSFVQPLQATPSSSYYNLKRITTTFKIKGWVDRSHVDVDGFASGTIDYMMLSVANGSNVTFRYQDLSITGTITELLTTERPDEMVGDEVEIICTFLVGTHL